MTLMVPEEKHGCRGGGCIQHGPRTFHRLLEKGGYAERSMAGHGERGAFGKERIRFILESGDADL